MNRKNVFGIGRYIFFIFFIIHIFVTIIIYLIWKCNLLGLKIYFLYDSYSIVEIFQKNYFYFLMLMRIPMLLLMLGWSSFPLSECSQWARVLIEPTWCPPVLAVSQSSNSRIHFLLSCFVDFWGFGRGYFLVLYVINNRIG